MEPRLVEADRITLVGFSFFGDPFRMSAGWTEENEIGRLWKRFMAYWMDRHKNKDAAKMTERLLYWLATNRDALAVT